MTEAIAVCGDDVPHVTARDAHWCLLCGADLTDQLDTTVPEEN